MGRVGEKRRKQEVKKEGIHVRVVLSCMFVSSDNMILGGVWVELPAVMGGVWVELPAVTGGVWVELPAVMGGVWVELPAVSCECA